MSCSPTTAVRALNRRRGFLAAFALGLVVRAAVLPLPGTEDVLVWKIWSYGAARDVTGLYGVGGTPPVRGIVEWDARRTTVNYPPMFLYEYALVGRAYGALFPSFPDGRRLTIAVKLPELFANIATALLLFALVRRAGGSERAAQWAALAFWLNPATFFGGELLGYVDALFIAPAIAALALAHGRRPVAAGVLLAIAIATKPQALLVAPAVALVTWQAGALGALASAAAASAATAAALTAPFALRGALPNLWLAFGSFDERRDTMSAFAANLGWIVNWWLRVRLAVPEVGWRAALLRRVPRPLSITRFRELGYPDPRLATRAIVAAAAMWAVWTARRARDLAAAAAVAAFTVHAFVVLSVGVHEHHQLLEVPLLALAAAQRRRLRGLFVLVSAIVALNIDYVFGAGPRLGWAVPRMATGVDLSVILAFINAGALAWFARLLQLETKTPAAATPQTTL